MKKFIIPVLAFTPFLASAQGYGSFSNISGLLGSFKTLIDTALPIIVGLALVGFFYGLAKFVFSAGNAENHEEGRNIMIWGVVALTVMISVWGLVNFLGTAFLGGSANSTAPNVPGIPKGTN